VEAGLYLAGRLVTFWESSDVREGERWLAKFVENPESKSYPLARAKALLAQGWLLQWLDRLDLARAVAQECLELYRMSDDKPGEVEALAVLAWTLDDLQIEISALGSFTWTSNRPRAMQLLNEALALAQALEDRGKQGRILGEMGWVDDDKVGRKSHFKKAIMILREVGDWYWLGIYLNHLAHHELLSDDLESAQKWLNEAINVNQQLNSLVLMEKNSGVHGHIELVKGNYREARAKLQECRSISETLGNRDSTLWNHTLLGQVALREGNLNEACKIFLETTYDFKQDQILIGVVFTLEGMAGFHIAIGKPERAACLIGWTDAIRERIPDKRFFLEQKDVDKIIAECIRRIGEAAFDVLYEKGKIMTLDEAVGFAFEKI
jgi:tetratricopeptide (TPR) repeat protein